MSSTASTSDTNSDVNPLTRSRPSGRRRATARGQPGGRSEVAKKSAKVQEKIASAAPAETLDEKAAAQTQAAPLGLAGDTAKKPKKVKVKGEAKERLAQQPKQPAAPGPRRRIESSGPRHRARGHYGRGTDQAYDARHRPAPRRDRTGHADPIAHAGKHDARDPRPAHPDTASELGNRVCGRGILKGEERLLCSGRHPARE